MNDRPMTKNEIRDIVRREVDCLLDVEPTGRVPLELYNSVIQNIMDAWAKDVIVTVREELRRERRAAWERYSEE